MNACERDYEQSLALHAAVAAKLEADPALLARARARLQGWLAEGGRSSPLWRRWVAILDGSPREVCAFLTERSEEAAWLRKASPFAGALSPAERLAVLRQVRERFRRAPA